MLFDPKWKKTEDNCEVTLSGFQQWVEAQNPKGRYQYNYKNTCAVGRWLKATDHQALLQADWRASEPLCWLDSISCFSPHTFGALSRRLRALADGTRRSITARSSALRKHAFPD